MDAGSLPASGVHPNGWKMDQPYTVEKTHGGDHQLRKYLLSAGFVLLAGLIAWLAVARLSWSARQERQQIARAVFEDQTGVRVLRVVLTAGGGMVDLQYLVLDPDRALALHDTESPPTLVDQKRGTALSTSFHSHTARELKTAVTYHLLILNAGGVLERGKRVTLKVGEAVLEDLIIE